MNPATISGHYRVHLELDEKAFDKEGIQARVADTLSKAKEDLSKAKLEFDEKMDTSFSDVSNAEGKLEYFVKSFAKTMSSFGKDLGEFGILLGEAAGDLAVKAMDLTEGLVSRIQLDVELQSDGKLVTHSDLLNKVQFIGSRWQIDGDRFLFQDEEKGTQHEFKISSQDPNQFVLSRDKYRLVFVKA